jgi:hypothetical protein
VADLPEQPVAPAALPALALDAAEDVYGRLFPHRMELGPTLDARVIPGHGGVYALTAADGTLLQLLETQSLRRAVAARLAQELPETGARRRADLRGVATTLWWRPAHSAFESAYIYLQIARQLFGAAYRKQLGMAPVWYARLDWRGRPRRWMPSTDPFGADVVSAGPFVTRQRAAAFVEALEELFDLCRYPQEIARAPHGVRCAYYDMGKCPAPCDGTVGMEVYDASLRAAAEFARGAHAKYLGEWHRRMSDAAAALDFETAQRFKERLAVAERALQADGRLAQTPESMRYFIVQRGTTASRVKPYFFAAGALSEGPEVSLRKVEHAADTWREFSWPSDNAAAQAAEFRTDMLTLISHFLAKGETTSGIYLRADALHDAHVITAKVRECFSRPSRTRAEDS